jgi:hypothetical protein
MDEALADLFRHDYETDRSAFLTAIDKFSERTGRSLQLHSYAVDARAGLLVTAAELPARKPRKLYVLTTGIHGIEGYAGSAIARHLLMRLLARLDPVDTSLLVVHALNPFGFKHMARVNANNVDLNRNCQIEGQPLFETDSTAFSALASVLAAQGPARVRKLDITNFYATLMAAYARHGARTLRQATLGGQYVDSQAVFYGGDRVQPEIAFFQQLFARLAQQHAEILLTDLHTGYGLRGEAYPLFGRADSPEVRAFTELGVSDERGRDNTYTVHGDLVGYCHATAKRLRPDGVFDGLVIEIGTHGLSVRQQLSDLYTVVLENQLRQHGADASAEYHVRKEFRELFYPSDREWQARAVSVGARAVERLLESRRFLRG